MSRFRSMKLMAAVALPAALLGVLLACSTDSPTAPQQQPAPAPGPPSAVWRISVAVTPDGLPADSSTPTNITVTVRRADTGVAPPTGTSIVVSSSLGEFDTVGSGLSSIALGTVNGRAQTILFPGSIVGTAVITAQLESSAGQATFDVTAGLPDLLAAFSFVNTTDNLSVQFVNESTGNPDRYHWDFGDGNTSAEKHPVHVYARPGDYAVELMIFRGDEFSETVQAVRAILDVFITAVEPNPINMGGQLRIRGQGFDVAIRVLVNGVLVDLISKSANLLVIEMPFGFEFDTVACDFFDETLQTNVPGEQAVPLTVTITVEVSGGVGSDSVGVDVLPDDDRCLAIEEEAGEGG